MDYKSKLIILIENAIDKIDYLISKKVFIEFLVEFKATLNKIRNDVKSDVINKAGCPRGLTRWLGEYIDQIDDKSLWTIVVSIDELLREHF